MQGSYRVIGVACVMILAGCGSSVSGGEDKVTKDPSEAQQKCQAFDTNVERVWSADTKATIRAELVTPQGSPGGIDTEIGLSEKQFNKIATDMDQLSEDWVRVRTMVCMDNQRGTLDDEKYSERVACLDQWLQQLRAVTQLSGDEHKAELAEEIQKLTDSPCFTQGPGAGAAGPAEGASAGGAADQSTTAGGESPADDRALAKQRTQDLFVTDDAAERQKVRSEVAVKVWFVKKTPDGREQTVYPGATMHSGERFFLRAEAEKALYVYITYIDPAGEAHLLFPSGGDSDLQLDAGEQARVPPRQVIQLDDEVGSEQIYVIASKKPLSQLGDDTAEALEAVREGKELPAYEAPKPPKSAGMGGVGARPDASPFASTAQMRTRGLHLVDEQDDTVWATTDEQGVAVVYFPIDHVE